MYITNIEAGEFGDFAERGARGVRRKTLVGPGEGSLRFYLRYYRLEPGGRTPLDVHDYEHIVVITKGRGSLVSVENGSPSIKSIKQGDVIFIGSREPHQFVNTGEADMEFLCFRGSEALYTEEARRLVEGAGHG